MATETMTLISSVTITNTTTANVNFSSIPQTYSHLVLVWSGVTGGTAATGTAQLGLRPNNFSFNYSNHWWIRNSGTSLGYNGATSQNFLDFWHGSLSFQGTSHASGALTWIYNYSSTTQNKPFSFWYCNGNYESNGRSFNTGIFNTTSAFTSLNVLYPNSSSARLPINTRLSLYGVH